MKKSKIEWTEKTWNPITGCTKISDGCKNCYAEVMARRLKAMDIEKYTNGFHLTLHPDALSEPRKWKRPQRIFVCSMSDLFHIDVPFSFIDKVIEVIASTPQHQYQILTKRADRMALYFESNPIPPNTWVGVTVESKSAIHRIGHLRDIQSTIKFLSCEPLLGDLGEIDLYGIDWIIVGGESGNQARPMRPEWVKSVLKQANKYNVAFFFKQWGTWGEDGVKRNKKNNGKSLDGRIYQNMP